MYNNDSLIKFVSPYYANKDIMHNMWHIELVLRMVEKILSNCSYHVDRELLLLATYFHGFIYKAENEIILWMKNEGYDDIAIKKATNIAWESQRNEVPNTIEGKILHDAHILEGGKTYLIVKTLITGSVRGQSLSETLNYMKQNVLNKNKCYLTETISLCDEMNNYTNNFYNDLIAGIQ